MILRFLVREATSAQAMQQQINALIERLQEQHPNCEIEVRPEYTNQWYRTFLIVRSAR